MADITAVQTGEVGDSMGKVNWHLGPGAVSPGGQSINKSSSVQLADLGQRLVVGDRVFRYAQLGAIAAVQGDLLQFPASSVKGFCELLATGGNTDGSGGKTFTFYCATSHAADFFAEGMLISQSGTAGNLGAFYRIKTHASVSDTANATLVLYDALQKAVNVTDKWSVYQNPYKLVTQNTAGTVAAVGVLACPATTNDYVWIQTWGPCAIKSQTAVGGVVVGNQLGAAATGAAVGFIATGTGGTPVNPIGEFLYAAPVASERNLAFIRIAP